MFKNHVITAFRNLVKHPGFTFIHIGGLAIGLTAGIFVLHNARLEYAYDEFHSGSNRIYRLSTARLRDGVPITHFATTYAAVGPAVSAQFPEVESYTRIFKRYRDGIISHEDTHFRETNIMHADSGFLKVFSFPILKGAAEDLYKPGSAFIEEQMVKKYFGDEDPIGKRISFGSTDGIEQYEIRGVIRCPENSSIKFSFIFNYYDLTHIFGTEHETNWLWVDFHTFVKLRAGSNVNAFEAKLKDLLVSNIGDRAANANLILQPLNDIYLTSKTQFETGITGNENTVRVLLILGIIILIIVALNFINLSTSRALTRAKEVGIRKALGSTRQNLIGQFLTETALIISLAGIICVLFVALLLPYFNQLTQRHIDFVVFATTALWKYVLVFFIVGTVIIGLYPALMLSSFRPVEVLKGFFSSNGKGALLRESFVGFQALVSFSLVVCILVILDQVNFVNKKDLGIDIDKTLVVRTPDVVTGDQYLSSLATYKNALLQDAMVLSVTTTVDSPGEPVSWISGARKVGADQNDASSLYRSVIDEDFIKVFGPGIVAGNMFLPNQSNHDIILNNSALHELKFSSSEESISQRIVIGSDTFTIIGVVEDFHQVSPRVAIAPTVYHYNLESPTLFMIKYEGNQESEIVELAGNSYHQIFPNVSFDYYFLDQFFDAQYNQERKLSAIASIFCVLAIVVSALGLLGLTWFRLSRQKKDLAIRKIIGSTDWQLFLNASRRLILTTIVGCAVGVPLTWYVMTRWLESFAYHTQPKAWEFGLALLSSLFIALLSISGHTLKVIKANPVDHLRQD